jgi:Putative Flp pilus-assembly TadE/G-like
MFPINHNEREVERKDAAGRFGSERGNVLILVCVTLTTLFAFAVLAVDGAILMTAKNQLQSAADAAALAGASGLLTGSQDEAIGRAIDFSSYNNAVEQDQVPVIINAGDVTFPESDVCRVRTHRTVATGDPLRTYFVRVISPGSTTSDMTAVAAARAYDVCGSKCIKPWVIPDRYNDANHNGTCDPGEYNKDATGYRAPVDVGVEITLKVGNPHQAIAPGIFFPVDYPPLNNEEGIKPYTGGSWYRQWISECEPFMIEEGDRLQLEPGNMVGPTKQGMEALIAQDPGARWDVGTQTIVNSAFGLSPRIGLVPFFDPTLPPTSGRNWVEVVKIGAFFIEDIKGNGDVTGRFMQITTGGVPCGQGLGNSLVKGIVLIE